MCIRDRITDTVNAILHPETKAELIEAWEEPPAEWQALSKALHQILDGERNENVLTEPLKYWEAAVVRIILMSIENPEYLEILLSS